MATSPGDARYWAEIDLLRALAGLFMISNHAAVVWGAPGGATSGLNGAISFVGSLAPTLFFFVTGLGQGISAASPSTRGSFADPMRKALVLFTADAAIWLSSRTHIGMDFLGFIGLSTLVLEVVRRTRRPVVVAAVAGGACFLLRFAVAPLLKLPHEGGFSLGALHFLLGDWSVSSVSYPIGPWLIYPLFGSILGRLAARHADLVRSSRGRLAAALGMIAALGFAACVVMNRRGLTFFRWGTMSFAYFVFSMAAAATVLALVLVVVRVANARIVRASSLAGMASFVLVPVQYGAIYAARPLFRGGIGAGFPLILGFVVPAILVTSKAIARRISGLAARLQRPPWKIGLTVVTLALLSPLASVQPFPSGLPLRVAVQLLACGLFALSSRAPAERVGRVGTPGLVPTRQLTPSENGDMVTGAR